MARVPIAENTVGIASPGVSARVEAPDMGAGGAMVGRALQNLGNQGSDFASSISELQLRRQAQLDDGVVKDRANQMVGFYTNAGFTADQAFFNQRGKNAQVEAPAFQKALDQQFSDARKGLSPHQQQLFARAFTPQLSDWKRQIAEHADREAATYDENASTSRVALVGNLARQVFVQDPTHADQQIATGKAEIEHLGQQQGWAPEQVTAKQLEFTSGVYQDVGRDIANAAGEQAPQLVDAFVKKYGGEMTDDARSEVMLGARVQSDHARAEREHQEEIQRRNEREARQDAHDRASSAMQNIDLGIPLKADDYATALTDARQSGDPGLLRRLEAGQLKGSLNLKYADATPPELQSRVGELSAQITRAGANVEPGVVIERDHLQTLLDKNRSELKTDMLGWGQKHLGIELAPLNLNDPHSIAARVSATTAIARRTGMTPRPLTQDEVVASQDTLQHGTVQQRVALALRVGKLGDLALPAAEQLSNDAGFQNLIGLATHSNAGVGASRVNQILTGQEVVKTRPELIDGTGASQDFNTYVGGALQFLPGVKAGVFTNAQAILAWEADRHGWGKWSQVKATDPRAWFRATNSALGAYTRDGKQVGGLAKVNGAMTVLPENMAQDEFESRIAKSNGPEYRRAQNGIPVFGNGSSPTATDLKKMQWIPVDDTHYRLGNGSEFLKTKDGHDYEIDISRLNPTAAMPGSPHFNAQLKAVGYSRY